MRTRARMGGQASCDIRTSDGPRGPNVPADALKVVRLANGHVVRRLTARWGELSADERQAVQDLADRVEGAEPDAELRAFDNDAVVARALSIDGMLVGMSRARPLASLSWRHTAPTMAEAEAYMLERGAPAQPDAPERLDLRGWAMSGTAVVPYWRYLGLAGMLVEDVLAVIGRAPVVVQIAEQNTPSLRLFERAGFVRTGQRWRDDGRVMLALRRQ